MGMSTADTKGQNGRHGDTTAPGGGDSAYFWMNKAIAKKRARMYRGNFLRCTIKKSQKDKKTSIFFYYGHSFFLLRAIAAKVSFSLFFDNQNQHEIKLGARKKRRKSRHCNNF